MTTPLVKGALVEYASDFLGPLPNVVVFQFNPETVTRTMVMPQRPTGAGSREPNQAGDLPIERYDMTLQLTADDSLFVPLTATVGLGPQLAALQKMVQTKGPLFDKPVVVDAVGSKVGGTGDNPVQLIPREVFPRILFIWGKSRVLPVVIESMTIVEKQYDFQLNPVLADVTVSMSVVIPDDCTSDKVAKGASKYSEGAKEVLAAANLAFATRQAGDIINLIRF
jgi:hypothetical protein